MPLPHGVAKLNKVGLNRVTRRIAPWAPGMGLVVHRGRRSGRIYETPVQVFRDGDGYVIALTYGPGADWTKNVLAAGGCELRTRGRTVQLTHPRLYRDETRQHIRPAEREMLRLLRVSDFLALETLASPDPT
jgi:deazaflavin-dependent oxidoreductase (nitroreductase family)